MEEKGGEGWQAGGKKRMEEVVAVVVEEDAEEEDLDNVEVVIRFKELNELDDVSRRDVIQRQVELCQRVITRQGSTEDLQTYGGA